MKRFVEVVKEPLITVKIPKLIDPPILELPEVKVGPLKIIEFRRVDPGELLPVNIRIIIESRKRG